MTGQSPPSAGSSTSNLFSRKSSLFSKKSSRNPLLAPTSPVAEEPSKPTITNGPNASVISLTSSANDTANSPRRSLSLRSHKSQSSGSYSPFKTRGGLPTDSPIRNNRVSRSISAGAATHQLSPRRTNDTQYSRNSPSRRNDQAYYTTPDSPLRAPLFMLGTPFARDLARRDSDKPSLNGLTTPLPPIPAGPPTGGYAPAAVYHNVHDTATKRMATLDYMRKVHEGHVFYFSTVSYSPANLTSLPSLHPARLGRRATNYLLLGTSLSPLLGLYASSPLDYLRVLAALLAEFDTYNQLSQDHGSGSLSRGRVGQIWKSGMRNVKSRRSSTAAESLLSDTMAFNGSTTTLLSSTSTVADSMPLPPISSAGHDFQFLQTPSLPFDPDFGTSFATLSDVLIDTYSGLLSLLPTPEACVPGVNEAFQKADKSLRKILISGIANEFGEVTRKEAKAEVGGLGKLVLSGLM